MDPLPTLAPERKILHLHNCLCVYSFYTQSTGTNLVDTDNITKSSSRAAPSSMANLCNYSVPFHQQQWISGVIQTPNPLLSFSLSPKNIPVLQIEGNPERLGFKARESLELSCISSP